MVGRAKNKEEKQTMKSKETIMQALRKFTAQRPGLEFANYGDVKAYRAEQRAILKDGEQARALLAAVHYRDTITADMVLEGCKTNYSGRLSVVVNADNSVTVDYCTGQYFPTEYRRAVCAVMAGILWAYWRDCGCKTGDEIRVRARKELGRGIAARWFR